MVGQVGNLELRAAFLDHRVTAVGYRLSEPDSRHFDPALLEEVGVDGPDVGRLLADGSIDTATGPVSLDDVTVVRRGQSFAFIMDTLPCPAAVDLAADADLVVSESTYLESEVDLARNYGHMTAAQAARMAVEAGARRLVLGHFSARYNDKERFVAEAGAIHPDVVVADDLAVVRLPDRRPAEGEA